MVPEAESLELHLQRISESTINLHARNGLPAQQCDIIKLRWR